MKSKTSRGPGAELRARALTKIKAQPTLNLIIVVLFILERAAKLFANVTGTYADMAIGAVIRLALALVFAGLACVSMAAWREGKSGWGGVFVCFRDGKRCARALCAGIFAVLAGIAGDIFQGYLPGFPGATIALALDAVAAMILKYSVFAGELDPQLGAVGCVKSGISALVKNIGKVLAMEIALYWWVLLLVAAVVLIAGAASASFIATRIAVFFVMLLVKWAAGGFIALSEAGLARGIMRE